MVGRNLQPCISSKARARYKVHAVKSYRIIFVLLLLSLLLAAGCGTGGASSPTQSDAPDTPPPATQSVFVVVLENKNYSDVVGSKLMPYLNSLVAQGGVAT